MNLSSKSFHSLKNIIAMCVFVLPAQAFATEINTTLQWVRTVDLSTSVSGIVERVHARKGDRVSANQVLMSLIGKAFQADVVARKAAVKKAENNFDEAQRELERTQELYDRTLLSDHDLQLAEIKRDAAKSEWQATRARLAQSEQDEYYSAVRAPFDAWVLQRNVQPGQVIIVNLQASPLMVLAEAGRMMARGTIDRSIASKAISGKKASVTVAGKTYTGKISFVAMEPVSPSADEYIIEVIFPSGKSVLRVGQTAKVKF